MKAGNSISIDFELKRKDGSLVDSSAHSGCLEYIEGLGMVPPGIERAISSLEEGEKFDVLLKAEDMYGMRDENNVMELPVESFHGEADELEAGIIIEADTPEGLRLMTVQSVNESTVILDANHPLAGEDLFFEGRVNRAAPATEEEIALLTQESCSCGCGGHGEDGCSEDSCGHGHKHDHEHGHGGGSCCCGHKHD